MINKSKICANLMAFILLFTTSFSNYSVVFASMVESQNVFELEESQESENIDQIDNNEDAKTFDKIENKDNILDKIVLEDILVEIEDKNSIDEIKDDNTKKPIEENEIKELIEDDIKKTTTEDLNDQTIEENKNLEDEKNESIEDNEDEKNESIEDNEDEKNEPIEEDENTEDNTSEIEKISLILKYNDKEKYLNLIKKLQKDVEIEQIKEFTLSNKLNIEKLEIETFLNRKEIINRLKLEDSIDKIDQDEDLTLFTTLDNNENLQEKISEKLEIIKEFKIIDIKNNSFDIIENLNEIKIGVVDTNINLDINKFKGRVLEKVDLTNDSMHYNETESHGTKISEIIIGANSDGVSPNANIIPIVVTNNDKIKTSTVIKAIEYAEENNISILNFSFGSNYENEILKEVMQQSNILFVVAAGNKFEESLVYPASYNLKNLISVAALDKDSNLKSNYGINIDIAAPGFNIYNEESRYQGTSISAAYVTGAASILKGLNKNINAETIKKAILKGATKTSLLNEKVTSSGYLNIEDAIKSLSNEKNKQESQTYDLKIPIEAQNIIDNNQKYSDLSEEEKMILFENLNLRQDIMTLLDQSNYSIQQSIIKAQIMQRLNIENVASLEEAIENCESEEDLLNESIEMISYLVKYRYLVGDDIFKFFELIQKGYKASEIADAYIVSQALNEDIKTVIYKKNNFKAEKSSLRSFSNNQEIKTNTIFGDLSEEFSVDESTINQISTKNKIPFEEIENKINEFKEENFVVNSYLVDESETQATQNEMQTFQVSEIEEPQTSQHLFSTGGNEQVNLNTGALSYTDEIMKIGGVNGNDFLLELKYNSDNSCVDDVMRGQGSTLPYKFENNPFKRLGAGWALNFSRVNFDSTTNKMRIRLMDGNTYDYDSKAPNTNLKGYSLENVKFEVLPIDWLPIFKTERYVLKSIDGTKEYFNDSGDIVGIMDKYANAIYFDHNNANTSLAGKITIKDSQVRSLITIDYTTTYVDFKNETNQSVVSYFLAEKNNGSNKTHVLNFKMKNGIKTTFDYFFIEGISAYAKEDISEKIFYSLLKEVKTYNSGTTYIYSEDTRFYGKEDFFGKMEGKRSFFKVIQRYDFVTSTDNKKNLINYEYSSKNFMSYPDYVVTGFYEYYIIEKTQDGNSKKHTFNNKGYKIKEELFNNADKVGLINYDYVDSILPTKIKTTKYNNGKSTTKTEENYYDKYGNLTAQYTSDGLKIAYEYDTGDFKTKYNILTQKKISKGFTIIFSVEKYILTDDRKNIKQYEMIGNGETCKKIEYTYDTKGLIKTIKTYRNLSDFVLVEYTYNNKMLAETVTTNSTKKEILSFDNSGNMITFTDSNGNVSKFEYDILNRLKKVTNADLTTKSYVYDDLNNTIKETNELGYSFTTKYTPFGQLEYIRNDKTGVYKKVYNYDSYYRVLTYSDATGLVAKLTSYTYDYLGRVKEIKISKNNYSNFDYKEKYYYEDCDASGYDKVTKVISEGNADQIKVSEYYDANGRLIFKSKYNDSNVEMFEKYEYDGIGNMTSYSNFEGKKTIYLYNYPNQLRTVMNPDSSKYSYEYDYLNNKTSVTDSKDKKTVYIYDNFGKLKEEQIPFQNNINAVKKYNYDKNGNLIETNETINKPTEATKFNKITYEYDNKNQLKTVKAYDNNVVSISASYVYDALGNIIEETVNGKTTTKKYNSDNQLINLIDSLDQLTITIPGMQTIQTDRNGTKSVITFDQFANPVTQTNTLIWTPNAEKINYEYQSNGFLTSKNTLISGIKNSYKYNSLGNIIQEKTTHSYSTTQSVTNDYTYDKNDNRKTYQFTDTSGSKKINTSYNYDPMGRLEQVQENGSLIALYKYDKNGNRESLAYDNGVTAYYTYNDANLITKLENKKGTAILSSYSYTYYLSGNIDTITTNVGDKTNYIYDDIGRLTKETIVNGSKTVIKSYEYDKNGNRSTMNVSETLKPTFKVEYTYDKNNRLIKEIKTTNTNRATTEYNYDKNGNQISKNTTLENKKSNSNLTVTAYILGNPRSEDDYKTELFKYNSFNQLTEIKNNSGTIKYTYDSEGLRSTKTVNGKITTFFYDGRNLIYETGERNNTYIYGVNLIKNSSNNYYLYNAHGDVVQLVSSSGAVIKTYGYDAFGQEFDPVNTDTNPFRYSGEYYDKETKTIYLKARHYNPENARFMSEDSYRGSATDPLSLNLYTYCSNNPVMYSDPSGHFAITTALVFGLVMAGVGFATVNLGMQLLSSGTHMINWRSVGASFVSGIVFASIPAAALSGIATVSLSKYLAVYGVAGATSHLAYCISSGSDITLKGVVDSATWSIAFAFVGWGLRTIASNGFMNKKGSIYIGGSKGSGSTLKFGSNDMVYGPSAGGNLRNLQESAGGKLLTDLPKPANSSWIDFSTKTIEATVKSGNYVRFDLTYMDDVAGALSNTGQYANTITAQELRYIQSNWGSLSNGIKFYNNGVEVVAPWIK